jgi:predicted nucleotidyltransferase
MTDPATSRFPTARDHAGLHLSPKHRALIEKLLREHLPAVDVWVYGSRVNGRSHEGSDLDLVLRGPGPKQIPFDALCDFQDAVRESTIPFLVGSARLGRLPESFHLEVERQHAVLLEG